jgi:hypothetical protein
MAKANQVFTAFTELSWKGHAMKFNAKLLGAALAATVAIAAPAANATTIQYDANPGAKSNFATTFTFTSPLSKAGTLDVYLRGVTYGNNTSVSFNSAKLDGVSLNLDPASGGGTSLYNLLSVPLAVGQTVTLVVNSTTAKYGQYSVVFSAGAVPEAATWALMVLGFGAVGYTMRRRVATASKLAAA